MKIVWICTKEIIFNGLNITSREETLNEIIIGNKSLSKFGDGEFKIIFELGIGFLKSSNLSSNLLIGLYIPYHE